MSVSSTENRVRRSSTFDDEEAGDDEEDDNDLHTHDHETPASPMNCVVEGMEPQVMLTSNVKCVVEFTIKAYDARNHLKSSGGEAFFVAVRGASKVRARVADHDDGTYTVQWHPANSGTYAITVSLFGMPLAGSPWTVQVHDPSPYPPACEVRGDSLHRITARTPSTFEIRYRDRGFRVAQAVEIDLFVVAQPEEDANADVASQPSAWDIATHPDSSLSNRGGGSKVSKLDTSMVNVSFGRKRAKKGGRRASVVAGAPPSAAVATTASDAPAEATDATAASAALEDDGYGSADGELLSLRDRVTTRRRAFPIEVGEKPLIVRREPTLSSEVIATLLPTQPATIIEEQLSPDGRYVRACVTFVALPPPPPRSPDASPSPSPGRSPVRSPGRAPSRGPPPSAAADHGSFAGGDGCGTGGGTDGSCNGSPEPSCSPSRALEPTPSRSATSFTKSGRTPSTISTSILAARSRSSKHLKHQDASSICAPKTARLKTVDADEGVAEVAASSRLSSRQYVGWATVRKNGKALVNSRVRQDPWVRQQAALLWKMQQLNDRLQLSLQTEAAMLDPTGNGFAFGGVLPGHLHGKGVLHEAHKVNYSVDRVGRYLLHVRLRQSARPVPGSPFALTVVPGAANALTTCLLPPAGGLVGEVGFGATDGCSLRLQTYDRVGNQCAEGGASIVATCMQDGKPVIFVTCSCEDLGDGSYSLLWQSKQTGLFDAKVSIANHAVRGSPMKIRIVSTRPDVDKTVLDGDGLRQAIAGQPATIRMSYRDEFGNLATPGKTWFVGLSIQEDSLNRSSAKKRVQDLVGAAMYKDCSGSWGEDEGVYTMTYIAKHAGAHDLYLWCRPEATVEALAQDELLGLSQPAVVALPGSPYSIHVTAGQPTALHSFCEPLSVTKKEGAKGTNKPAAPRKDDVGGEGQSTEVTAGDIVSVRANGVDEFKNPALLEEAAFTATVTLPDGKVVPMDMLSASAARRGAGKKDTEIAGCSVMYELRYETVLSGTHHMNVLLYGEPLQDSPIIFEVLPSAPTHGLLTLPEHPEALIADLAEPATIVLSTFDKYDNKCVSGGLRVAGRLLLVKQGIGDNSILMPNNHFVETKDNEDGTYDVQVAIILTATVKLLINMDKDSGNDEMAPVLLSFAKPGTTPLAHTQPATPTRAPSAAVVPPIALD